MSGSALLARVAGLKRLVDPLIERPQSRYFDPALVLEYFDRYEVLRGDLAAQYPELYGDLRPIPRPEPSGTTDYDGRGYIERPHLDHLRADLGYILEVRANSELAAPREVGGDRVFLSHGRSDLWRQAQAFIERDLGMPTLELSQEPNLGRTVIQKLVDESTRCFAAVIVMTGDDVVGGAAPRARENVIHEIGFFQGRLGLDRICLVHEEGTNIPSNISGLVYIPFPTSAIDAAFATLGRELTAIRSRV